MKLHFVISMIITLAVALAAPVPLAAQQHHHYKLIDLGTLGGSGSFVNSGQTFIDSGISLNQEGVAWGSSATGVPTSPTSNGFACEGIDVLTGFVTHAFRWQNGVITDLGALPGEGNCSISQATNASGETVGISENGEFDPVSGFNQSRAVLWRNGTIKDLGSLAGNQTQALAINDRGQIVGSSQNMIPDPFSIQDCILEGTAPCIGTQTRAILWQNGEVHDLGSLGNGNDAIAGMINNRGQVAGISTTSAIPNPITGIPPVAPFFWENGKMVDIGGFGGAFGETMEINNRGQVIGGSSTAASPGACLFSEGDPDCHPFLWDDGRLTDLSTSTASGTPLIAYGINDSEEIVGVAAFPDGALDAYLWRNGTATDLGNLGDCVSFGNSVNLRSQVVGGTLSCADGTHSRAFLWEGGAIVDLNTLVPSDSSLNLVVASDINDRGEIMGQGLPLGVTPADYGTQGHAFLLIPCDENHPNIEGCDYSPVDDSTLAAVSANSTVHPQATSNAALRALIERIKRPAGFRANPWFHGPGPQSKQ